MDLQSLKFTVDTADLDRAKGKLLEVASAYAELSRAQAAGASKATQAESSKKDAAGSANAVTKETIKLEADKENASKKSSSTISSGIDKLLALIKKEEETLAFMRREYSKGQSSVLAYATALNATEDQLKSLGSTLDSQRQLQGNNPFDKSIGAVKALKNELAILTEVQALYNAGVNITSMQAKDLARDEARLLELMKGRSDIEKQAALAGLKKEYIDTARTVNNLTASQKEHDRATKDSTNAMQYIEREMQRVAFGAANVGGEFSRTASNGLFKFQEALKISGMSVDQQREKLALYRADLLAVNTAAAKQKTDYITRAVGPQITDIFVGLATGQSPLTVALQQGGQLRDQFGQFGIAAKDMATIMRTSARDMVVSIKGVVGAMSSLVYGAVKDATAGLGAMATSALGIPKVFELWTTRLADTNKLTLGWVKGLQALGATLNMVVGAGILGTVVVLTALAYQLYKIGSASTDLAQSMSKTGASMGYSAAQVTNMAKSMDNLGVSIPTVISVFEELSKQGNLTSGSIKEIAESAILMEKYVGVSVKDTAKAFSELKSAPLKTLEELAKVNGLVSISTLENVRSLTLQGKTTEAARVATEALIEANRKIALQAKSDMSPLDSAWIDIKSSVISATNSMLGFIAAGVKFKIVSEWSTFNLLLTEIGDHAASVESRFKSLFGIFEKPPTLKEWGDNLLSVLKLPLDALVEIEKRVKGLSSPAIRSSRDADGGQVRKLDNEMEAVQIKVDAAKAAEVFAYWTKIEEANLQEVARAQREYNKELGKFKQDRPNMSVETEKAALSALIELRDKVARAKWNQTEPGLPKFSNLSKAQLEENQKTSEQQIQFIQKVAKERLDIEKAAYDSGLIDAAQFAQKKINILLQAGENERGVISSEMSQSKTDYQKYYSDLEAILRIYEKAVLGSGFSLEKKTAMLKAFGAEYNKLLEGAKKDEKLLLNKLTDADITIEVRVSTDVIQSLAEYNKSIKETQNSLQQFNKEEEKRIQDYNEQRAFDKQIRWASPEQVAAISAAAEMTKKYTEQIAKSRVELEKARKEMENSKWMDDGFGGVIFDPESPVARAALENWKQKVQQVNTINAAQRVAVEKSATDAIIDYYDKERKALSESIADAILTGIFEGGDAGAKALRNILIAELKKPLKVTIEAFVSKVVNSGLDSLLGALKNIGVGDSSKDVAGNVYTTDDGGGTPAPPPNSSGGATGGGLLGQVMGSFGQAFQAVFTSIIVGQAVGSAVANGFTIFKNSDKLLGAIGGAIGMAVGGPIGAVVGAALGGLLNRAFGRKLTEAGFQANYSNGVVSGNNYTFEEGGWFRSDKTTTSALDPEISRVLRTGTNAIIGQLREYAVALGINADVLRDFTYSFKANLKDMKPDEIKAELEKMLGEFTQNAAGTMLKGTDFAKYLNDFMADSGAGASTEEILKFMQSLATVFTVLTQKAGVMKAVFEQVITMDDVFALKKQGEDLDAAFKRLIDTFAITNVIVESRIGKTSVEVFGAIGLASEAARSRLVTLAGGIDALGSGLTSYFQNFYTQAERDAMNLSAAQKQVNSVFEQYGYVVPKTRAEFRALMDSLDLSTEAGARAYASLLGVSEAFALITKTADIVTLAGMAKDSIVGLFQTVISSSRDAEEARQKGTEAAGKMFFDSMMSQMLGVVSQMIVKGIVEPMSTQLLGSINAATAQQVTAATASATVTQTAALSAGANIALAGEVAMTNMVIGGQTSGTMTALGGEIASQDLVIGAAIAAAGLTAVVAEIVNTIAIMQAVITSPEFIVAYKGFTAAMGEFSAQLFTASVGFPGYVPYEPDEPEDSNNLGKSAAQTAYDILVKAISKQKELAKAQLDLITEIYDATVDAIKTLTSEVDSVQAMKYDAARAFITQVGLDVKNGILPDATTYKDAVTAAVAGIQGQVYTSKFEEDRARLIMANELQAIADVLGPQKTSLEIQIEYLDGLLSTARDQLDSLNGNSIAIMSLTAAIANWTLITGQLLPGAPAFTPQLLWTPPSGSSGNSTISGGFNLFGAQDNTALVEELRALKEEVVMLRAEVRADVAANTKTSRILERVTPDGNSIVTTVV